MVLTGVRGVAAHLALRAYQQGYERVERLETVSQITILEAGQMYERVERLEYSAQAEYSIRRPGRGPSGLRPVYSLSGTPAAIFSYEVRKS